jgi:hypothetical protein
MRQNFRFWTAGIAQAQTSRAHLTAAIRAAAEAKVDYGG